MTETRQRRTPTERRSILERWQQSGRSAREFAGLEGLKASSLYLWRKQLKAASSRELRRKENKPAFSELRLTTTSHVPVGHIEIVTRNGRTLRVCGDVSMRALQQVLAAVEQC
jgi:transposase-like protein